MVLWRSFPVVLLLGFFAAPAAFGQAKNSPIAFANEEAITTTFVEAPTVDSGDATASNAGSSAEPAKWLKVEFHYGTTPLVTDDYPYVDEIQFKVWIEGIDRFAKNPNTPTGKGVAIALTGSVTYINVPSGKDIYGVFFVPPSVLARYSSDKGYTDFDRKFNVHVEALIGGNEMDHFDKNKDPAGPDWYTEKSLKPITGLVYRQDQCPFMMSDPDRYPIIKPPAPAAQ